jgi:hypothetical protein
MKDKTTALTNLLLAAAAFAVIALPARAQDATATTPATTTGDPYSKNQSSAAATAPLGAPAASPGEDQWQFDVTVPLWAPQIIGDVTVQGQKQDVNISFQELKDHLDASFALGLNASKGKFGLYSCFGYMKFSAGDSMASSELKFIIAEAGMSYLLVKTDGEHPFVLAGTAGLRYWYADPSISLSPGVVPPGGFSGGKTFHVYDPVIGLRGSQYLTRKFHLDFAGDFGGFDINNDTDWTWSATAVGTYDFSKHFSLSAGYRALALDESSGSGASKNGVNLIFNGVLVNATFKF